MIDSSGSATNPYQFSSKSYDSNSGFSYFGRRHYTAQLGRFVTQDPKEYIDGLNTYAYVKNNPVNLIDLLGLCPNPGTCAGLLSALKELDKKLFELGNVFFQEEYELHEMNDCIGGVPDCIPWFSLRDLANQTQLVIRLRKECKEAYEVCKQAKSDYEQNCEQVEGFHHYCE